MMLAYNLPATDAIYQRFAGIEGSAYFVGGLGMTALTMNNIVVVPVRTGVGIRLGANVGYLKFTPTATWNPFCTGHELAAPHSLTSPPLPTPPARMLTPTH